MLFGNDQTSVGLEGDFGLTLLVDLKLGEHRLTLAGIVVILKGLSLIEHRKVEGQREWFVLC